MKNKLKKTVIFLTLLGFTASGVAPVGMGSEVKAAEKSTTLSLNSVDQTAATWINESKMNVATFTGGGGGISLGGLGAAGAAGGFGGVVMHYATHRKNARKSTHDKHTKKRPGGKEKKKVNKNWKRNR